VFSLIRSHLFSLINHQLLCIEPRSRGILFVAREDTPGLSPRCFLAQRKRARPPNPAPGSSPVARTNVGVIWLMDDVASTTLWDEIAEVHRDIAWGEARLAALEAKSSQDSDQALLALKNLRSSLASLQLRRASLREALGLTAAC
jgi:hypothetical protein